MPQVKLYRHQGTVKLHQQKMRQENAVQKKRPLQELVNQGNQSQRSQSPGQRQARKQRVRNQILQRGLLPFQMVVKEKKRRRKLELPKATWA